MVALDMVPLSGDGAADTIAWICQDMIDKVGPGNIVEVALDGTCMGAFTYF